MDDVRQPEQAAPAHVEPAHPAPAGPRPTRAATTPPPVKLAAYEGPLDLLLDLIRTQQINIYDIPIAQITQQYLDYLRMLEEMNIDVAGEFILLAATLIHIKSRMLLPPDPTASAEERDDPRTELVERLLEHEQFKSAAEMLQSRRGLEEAMWSQPGIGEFIQAEDEPGVAVSVFDLIGVFREILERARKRSPMSIHREEVSVSQMIEHMRRVLISRPDPVRLDDLIAGYVTRPALIALLLGLLEMVRLRAIQIRQKELFAPITVHRHPRFAEIMAGMNPATLQLSFEQCEGNAPADPGGEPPDEGALPTRSDAPPAGGERVPRSDPAE